jgi:uncharacterized protein YegL
MTDTWLDGDAGEGLEEDWGEELLGADLDLDGDVGPRCPVVLLVDTSRSMAGEPLAAVRRGLEAFCEECTRALAGRHVEVAVVAFGGSARVTQDFLPAANFVVPTLEAQGDTLLAAGLLAALDVLAARHAAGRAALLLWTDGMPQGESPEQMRAALRRLRHEEAAGRLRTFAVGVPGANRGLLTRIARRAPLKSEGLRFAEVFAEIGSEVGNNAALIAPTAEGERRTKTDFGKELPWQ